MRKYCCKRRWIAEWVGELYLLLSTVLEVLTLRLFTFTDAISEHYYNFILTHRVECHTKHPRKPDLKLIVNNTNNPMIG